MGLVDIARRPNLRPLVRDAAIAAVWKELALTRQGYAGLEFGLHYPATMAFPNRILHPSQRARMRSILQDGVWTPLRAHRVGAGTEACTHCGVPQADVAQSLVGMQGPPIETPLMPKQTDGPFPNFSRPGNGRQASLRVFGAPALYPCFTCPVTRALFLNWRTP